MRPNRFAPMRLRFALSLLAIFTINLGLGGLAGAQTSQWRGPWDWKCDVFASATPPCVAPGTDLSELSHAALIPTGVQRGKVLIWRNAATQGVGFPAQVEAWMFDPASPASLVHIIHPQLQSDLFCSGQSWDSSGRLIVAGGITAGAYNTASYEFLPRALGPVTLQMAQGTLHPVIVGSPNWTPWMQLGYTELAHWYPTLMTLTSESIAIPPGCSAATMPGGSTLEIGGCKDTQNPLSPDFYRGIETWERMSGGTWGCPLTTAGVTLSQPAQIYSLLPISNLPDPQLNSYPRAFQLSTSCQKQIFIANDTDSFLTQPYPTAAGSAWVMKLPYLAGPGGWQLHGCPPQPHVANYDGDRVYGNALLLHTLGRENRIIVLNGAQLSTNGSSPSVNQTILEYAPGVSAEGGTWTTKMDLTSVTGAARFDPNAVILPTREILILGGGNGINVNLTSPLNPVFTPYTYDPGDLVSSPGILDSSYPPSHTPSGFPSPTPRLYHAFSVLMPDGSILLAGGDNSTFIGPNFPPPNPPDSEFSGEVFLPRYFFNGFRPTILDSPEVVKRTQASFEVDVTIQVQTGHSIDRVVLLRPASVTHFFDMDQRYIELSYTAVQQPGSAKVILSVIPPASDLGPDGWYLLYVVETDGSATPLRSPSVGQFIQFPSL